MNKKTFHLTMLFRSVSMFPPIVKIAAVHRLVVKVEETNKYSTNHT